MQSFPLVSLVVPTFNQGRYLPATIDNCLFQTYPNIELIIVDGGSTDSTKSYLRSLEHNIRTCRVNPVVGMTDRGEIVRESLPVYPQHRDLKIVSFDQDIGSTRTYNEGFSRISGKYCTYIVGDDLPHPHMVETLVEAINKTHVDFVYSDMNVVDDEGRLVRQIKLPDYSFETCFAKWYFLGVSHLYKTEWHQKVGLMDEAYQSANDYDHYLRFAMAGATFYHLPRILYSVRFHGDNRRTGQHTPARKASLMEESKHCALRARQWLSMKERRTAQDDGIRLRS